MGRTYDNWGRLVEVIMRREQLRTLSLSDSRSPSTRSLDSDYSCSSSCCWLDDGQSCRTTPSPLQLGRANIELVKSRGKGKVVTKRRNAVWKGLSIFGGFSSKKQHIGREEEELKWSQVHKTFHGHEISRLQELHTIKGHIESMVRAKGLNIDSIPHYYTI